MRIPVLAITTVIAGCNSPRTPIDDPASTCRSYAGQPATKHAVVHPAARAWNRGLYVAETNTWPLPRPVTFALSSIWKYDPDSDRWMRVVRMTIPQPIVIAPVRPTAGAGVGPRRILELPEQVGLYWVTWTEDGHQNGTLILDNPFNCQDVEIGNPPPGKIAACVPFGGSVRAQFVPDPTVHCK